MTAAEERTVTLAGRDHAIRPTFRVIAAAEQAAGLGAYALGLRLASAEFRVAELAAVLHAMLRASGGTPPRVEEIGEALMEDGVAGVVGPMADILLRAFQGNRAWRAQHVEREAEPADPLAPPG